MAHLILTGPTGLVGSAVLDAMLRSTSVSKVTLLTRRQVPQAQAHANGSKATTIIHSDYLNYPPSLLSQLTDADGCVWAQGISVNQVDKDTYQQITVEHPLAFARAVINDKARGSRPFTFVYVSGEGATTTPGALTAHFGRVKGEAESALLEMSKQYPHLKIWNVRPGGVDPGDHPEIQQFLPTYNTWLKRLEQRSLPLFRTIVPSLITPTRGMGEVFTKLATGEIEDVQGNGVSGEGRTLNNVALRRLM